MRIVHVVHYFLPAHVAGVEVYTFHLARSQARRHQVSIFTREDGHFTQPLASEEDRVGELPVHRVFYNRPLDFESIYRNAEIDAAFDAYLKRLRPDVVHFQHLDRLSAGLIDVAAARGLATVLTLHDYWLICPQIQLLTDGMQPCLGPEHGDHCARCGNVLAESIRRAVLQQLAGDRVSRQGLSFLMDRARAWLPAGAQAKLMRWLERRGLRRYVSLERSRARYHYLRARFEQASAVTAPSRFLIEQFRTAGFDSRPIEYIDYGIPIPQSAARLPAAAYQPLRCGYLSTVVPFKGIEVALEAFRGIDPSQAELWVRAPGYPPYVAEIQRRAADLPHVHFLGPYAQDQIGAVFQDLDVLLVPSLWYENSPLIIHEAAAAQVPVIATDLGGMAEYVHEGDNGLLFRRGDAGHLRQRILELAGAPERLSRLRRPPFPIKSIAENAAEFEALYQRVLRRFPKSQTPNRVEVSG